MSSSPGLVGSLLLSVVAALALPGCGAMEAPETASAPPETALAPPSSGSHAAGSDVLAVALGTEVRLIALDGSSTTVLAGDPVFAGVNGVDLVGASRFVLVRAYAEQASELRYAMLGSDARVSWTQRFAVSYAGGSREAGGAALSWRPMVTDDGAVVVADDLTGGARTLALGGVPGELAGWRPIGNAVGGYVPVASTNAADPSTTTYAWWKMGAGQQLESAEARTTSADDPGTSPVPFGDSIVRLERRDGSSVLRVQTRAATATIALPRTTAEAAILRPSNDEMFGEERWLLVASGVEGRVVRVDVAASVAYPVDVVAPAGYRPFSACQGTGAVSPDLQIDRDGRIYGVFRNDDRVAVFTTIDGSTWSQLGGSFTGVGGLDVRSTRGTYTLRGHQGAYCYGAGPTWTSPSGADFAGDVTQVVRPSAGTRITLPATAGDRGLIALYTLSRSGRFAAGWVIDAGVATLRVIDLETGVQSVVATDRIGIRSDPAWLWKP